MRPISSSLYTAVACAAVLMASTSGGSALSFAVGSRGGLRSGSTSAAPPPIGGQQTGLDFGRGQSQSGFGDGRPSGRDRGDRFGGNGCGYGGGRGGSGGGRSFGVGGGFGGYSGCGGLDGFGGYAGGYGGFGYPGGGYGDSAGRNPGIPSVSGIRAAPVLPPAIYVIEPTRRGARSGAADVPTVTGSVAPPTPRGEVLASGVIVTRITP